MTTITWPSNDNAFRLATFTRKQRHNLAINVSSLNGATQTVALPGMRWVVTVGLPEQNYTERQRVAGFLASLAGGANRLALWDYANPSPARLSGSPLINGAVAQFASTINIDGTLLGGDNLLRYSQDLSNVIWSKSSATVTADTAVAPDGTSSADKAITTLGTSGGVFQTIAGVSPSTGYCFSFYAMATGVETNAGYRVYDNTGAANIVASTSYFASINSAAFTRVVVPFTTPAGCTSFRVYVSSDIGGVNSGAHIWGAKVNLGLVPTDYTGIPGLRFGDWLSVPLSTGLTQLLRVTGDVSGEAALASVPVADALRASVADNAVVTINKPVGLYVPVDPNALEEPYGGFHKCPPTQFDLVEVFS